MLKLNPFLSVLPICFFPNVFQNTQQSPLSKLPVCALGAGISVSILKLSLVQAQHSLVTLRSRSKFLQSKCWKFEVNLFKYSCLLRAFMDLVDIWTHVTDVL